MKVYVLRHGLTPLNKKRLLNAQIDEPLAPEGTSQAKAAIALIPKTVKYIYTSSLLRTKQTADIINSIFNLPIFSHDELKEIHMGSLAGKSWDDFELGEELKQKHRSIQFNYHKQGGESAANFKKRIINFLQKINDKHKNNEVLIVTHGGIIRLLHLLEHNKELLDEIGNTSLHTFNLDKILKIRFKKYSRRSFLCQIW